MNELQSDQCYSLPCDVCSYQKVSKGSRIAYSNSKENNLYLLEDTSLR